MPFTPDRRREWRKRRFAERRKRCFRILMERDGPVCSFCGLTILSPESTVIHDRDPALKTFEWCKIAHVSWVRIAMELMNCELMHKGCHCNLHLNSRGAPYEYSVDDDEWDELISVNIGIPRLDKSRR